MDFFEVIDKRHSYRGEFKDIEVPEEDIKKILLAGIKAPSGYNLQTTTFVVVTDENLRKSIAEILPTEGTKTAPMIIVVLTEKVGAHYGLSFEIEDYGASTENVMLAITALGYASVWIDGMTKLEGREPKIAKLLNVPDGKTVRAILPVGVPVSEGVQKEKKAFEERVTYNKFK
jgi:nitroreductase